MAITRNGAGAAPSTSQEDKQPTQAGTTSIGFGSALGLMGATRGSEYTNSIAKVMQEMYSGLTGNAPKINVFDKERLNNLAYSCIVVSMPNGKGSVCFHISVLEATGLEPMRASEIVTEATRAIREPGAHARIYTPDDAINAKLHEIVVEELSGAYSGNDFISTDGLVVHNTSLDVNDLAMRIAAIAYNAVFTEAKLSSGAIADLNVAEAIDGSRRSVFRLESNLYHTTITNIMGSPTRQDFKIDLVEVDQANNFELNADTRRRLVSVGGYIDAIREDIPVNQQMGMAPITNARLHPNVIITNNDAVTPTQGFMTLGVISATVMARPELWLQSLASIDAKSHNSPGILNIITNIENNQNGVGEPLNFSAKEVTTEEHYAALQQMYSLAPVVSYDVESFGAQTYYSSVLAAAASPDQSSSKMDALEEIVETCAQLTNGNFPLDFPKSEIFAVSGVVIPMGYWMDKAGERDIRDIDMSMVANQTSDVNIVNKWSMTALPKNITGLDPFLTKVEIINQLVPDAVINGKAVRVTFTSKFIQALVAAVEAAGLVARYDAGVVINEQYNTKYFADYLATAGLSHASGFAQQQMAGGNDMNTGYTNMGRSRW